MALTWQNVNDPDLGKAASILEGAVSGFSNGFDGLAANLTGVRDRQRRDRSAAAMPALAGVMNGGDASSALAQIAGMMSTDDMTPELQQAMLGIGTTGLERDGMRVRTNVAASGEARNQTDFDRRISVENDMASLTPEAIRRREAALAGGDSISASGSLISSFEGYRDNAYNDNGTGFRAGYGSDTTTLANGDVVPITPNSVVNREDSDRDLKRRIETEFQPAVIDAIGAEAFDSMSNQQKAVLNSLTYNYGAGSWSTSLAGVRQAVLSGDARAVASEIASLGSHNDGINQGRRNEEAAIFAGSSSMADMIPEGSLIQPQDMIDIVQENYDAGEGASQDRDSNRDRDYTFSRLGITDGRTDRDDARNEELLAEQEATKTMNEEMILQAQSINNSVLNEGEFSEAVAGMDLTPEERTAIIAAGAAQRAEDPSRYAATSPGAYSDTMELALASAAGDVAVESSGNTVANALEAIGHVFGSEDAVDIAGEGTDPVARSKGVMTQIAAFRESGELPEGIEDGTIVGTVNQISADMEIDPRIVMSGVTSALSEGRSIWTAFPDGTLEIDEDKLREIMKVFQDPDTMRRFLEDQRQTAREQEDLVAMSDEQIALSEVIDIFGRRDGPEAEARVAEAQARYDEIERILTEMGEVRATTADKIYEKGNPVTTESELVSANSGDRRAAIVAGQEIAGPRGDTNVISPTDSVFSQVLSRGGREREIRLAIAPITAALSGDGGGPLTGGVGKFLDNFRENPEGQASNMIEREVKNDARLWLQSDAALNMFLENPELLAEAEADPVGFYERATAE